MVYLEDQVVKSGSLTDHPDEIWKVFDKLAQAALKLNLDR